VEMGTAIVKLFLGTVAQRLLIQENLVPIPTGHLEQEVTTSKSF
jgi:hypothetical protein